MRYCKLSVFLSLCAIALLGGGLSVQAQTTTSESDTTTQTTTTASTTSNACNVESTSVVNRESLEVAKVQLYYFRNFQTWSTLICGLLPDIEVHPGLGENEIILKGTEEHIREARRIVAAIDLPRPGVNMQMWAIQISSKDADDLAKVMIEVYEEISQTQQLIQETYGFIQAYAANEINQADFDPEFLSITEQLGYESALFGNRPLSLIDIVLRIVAAESYQTETTADMANSIMEKINNGDRYQYYLDYMNEQEKLPFQRFFSSRGLKPCTKPNDSAISIENCYWQEDQSADLYARQTRNAILEFALHYGHFVGQPKQFSPYYFQQSTDVLNNQMQNTVDNLNQDIEDFFVRPTLLKIQKIVGEYKEVEYAQVGRTTIASLDGSPSEIKSESYSTFDRTPPLSFSELLTKAEELSPSFTDFLPQASPSNTDATDATQAGEILVGDFLPLSKFIGLFAAYEQQNRVWQTLKTGITLNITPNVLRNMRSAELDIDLTIVDPAASNSQEVQGEGEKIPELSRIGTQEVNTRVYTNTVDFFAFSTFSNQSTLDGGRGYVPIVGTVWRGVFGSIPVLGDLFSWKKSPQNVLHESLLLTNTFITPTAMGLGVLYPVESGTLNTADEFCQLQEQVYRYIYQDKDQVTQVREDKYIYSADADNKAYTYANCLKRMN